MHGDIVPESWEFSKSNAVTRDTPVLLQVTPRQLQKWSDSLLPQECKVPVGVRELGLETKESLAISFCFGWQWSGGQGGSSFSNGNRTCTAIR